MVTKKKINNKIYETECKNCGEPLEFTIDDVEKVAYSPYIVCPCCGEETEVDNDESFYKDVTSENFNYPADFFDFSNGIDLDKATQRKYIDTCIDYLKANREEDWYYNACGNFCAVVLRCGNDYKIIVTDKYKQLEIPEE